jgi:glutamate-1-semialdehyde 2,1-aminomutase
VSQVENDYLEKWTPGGSQTASKAPGRAGPRGGGYPSVLSHGQGALVWDEDGREFVDFVASLAAVGLGHADPRVVGEVEWELKRGNLLSLPTRLEGLASEALCRFLAWPEQVRWVKTGSEATEAAVRICRAATGRAKVLTVQTGYHAWHSWFQAVKPEHPGVPQHYADAIDSIDYGTYGERPMAYTEAMLATGRYACVILEPAPITGGGSREWLARLKEVAHRHGTLLVFDEVVWGFRLAKAGGTEHFTVVPDLATYGKAMGNGVPVAAVVGGRDLMRHAALVSGTYGGDRLGLAAAMAVIKVYDSEPVTSHLWEMGQRLIDGVNRHGTTVQLSGYPVHPVPIVPLCGRITGEEKRAILSLYLQEMAARGVLWHPGGLNVMYSHTSEHVERAVTAAGEANRVVSEAVSAGTVRAMLRGEPYEAAFTRASEGAKAR